ncbi:ubiquinol-cytochrome c chaperone [Polymorphobacter multimanifer]|uniref:Cytochrome b pre-mRNA-processing protein 3 n=1 Tax=Polymorphobacter multimanifer TaxID=1070431 RepID=A0A841LC16_9SPHN|nr:cytochrome b pre-mRNA-processing protein 3 [Polymorphobacter multimanifer]GGI75468.1 ubiquinol-cytochrome c chaperone [Polymorphobacter multimanifer]
MSLFSALKRAIGAMPADEPGTALYAAIVGEARRPDWYVAGEVPDTMDGRFDMVALVLSLTLMRLEADTDRAAPQASADITDRFITDMDGNLRQDGVGDQVVGKHLGRMMAALGGRLGAYREAGADDAVLAQALARNLWRGQPHAEDALAWVTAEARRLQARLAATPFATLHGGGWPSA